MFPSSTNSFVYLFLDDLKSFGVSSKMFNTFGSHTSEKTLRVRVWGALSDVHVQKMAFLNVESWAARCLYWRWIVFGKHCRLYSKHLLNLVTFPYLNDRSTFVVNRLAHWADENGFKSNPVKNTCAVFSKRHWIWPEPVLKQNGDSIPGKKWTEFFYQAGSSGTPLVIRVMPEEEVPPSPAFITCINVNLEPPTKLDRILKRVRTDVSPTLLPTFTLPKQDNYPRFCIVASLVKWNPFAYHSVFLISKFLKVTIGKSHDTKSSEPVSTSSSSSSTST